MNEATRRRVVDMISCTSIDTTAAIAGKERSAALRRPRSVFKARQFVQTITAQWSRGIESLPRHSDSGMLTNLLWDREAVMAFWHHLICAVCES